MRIHHSIMKKTWQINPTNQPKPFCTSLFRIATLSGTVLKMKKKKIINLTWNPLRLACTTLTGVWPWAKARVQELFSLGSKRNLLNIYISSLGRKPNRGIRFRIPKKKYIYPRKGFSPDTKEVAPDGGIWPIHLRIGDFLKN